MTVKTVEVKNQDGDVVATYSNAKIVVESSMLYVKDADSDEVLWVSTMSKHFANVKQP